MADQFAATALDGNRKVATHAGADSRALDIYSNEHGSLRLGEAFHLLVKSWPFIAAQRRLVLLKTAISIASMALFLIIPWPMKIVIDNVIGGHPLSGIPGRIIRPIAGDNPATILMVVTAFLLIAAVLVGTAGDRASAVDARVESGGLDQGGFTANQANDGWSLWNGLLGLFEVWLTLDLSQRMNQDLRTAIYDRFLRSPLGLYGDQKIGDAVFRVMHDSSGISAVFYQGVLAPILAIVMFVLTMIVLTAQFSNEPMILIVNVAVLPVIAIGAGLFSRVFRDQAQRMREQGSNVMAAFEERLAHVHLIKAFGTERRETHAIDTASWDSFKATLKMLGFIFALALILAPALGFLVMVAIYHLMSEVIAKRITLGDVVLLASYGMLLGVPMGQIGATWATLQGPISGLRRTFSVLDRLNEGSAPGPGDVDPGTIRELEFRNVAIAYGQDSPVVRDLSFTLRTGQLTSFAGPSGTGKTTILCSIPRFFEPCSGEILANGIDIRRVALPVLRDRIGFVFQQEALFSRSIADNIRYGAPDASDEQMREAARIAGAAEFIDGLPNGYDTMLGRRGARLSVGQKQRIAIARAVICHPDVLILDEPTAPLDPVSEAGLLRTLREISRERIVLIVAHRSNTLAACDRVLFIRDGALMASGTHEELRRGCGPYREYLSISESVISE